MLLKTDITDIEYDAYYRGRTVKTKPDLISVAIVDAEGVIYEKWYFDSSSDCKIEFEQLHNFISDHKGDYELFIDHYDKRR